MYYLIFPGTPWNLFKHPWGSPDTTLRTTYSVKNNDSKPTEVISSPHTMLSHVHMCLMYLSNSKATWLKGSTAQRAGLSKAQVHVHTNLLKALKRP